MYTQRLKGLKNCNKNCTLLLLFFFSCDMYFKLIDGKVLYLLKMMLGRTFGDSENKKI